MIATLRVPPIAPTAAWNIPADHRRRAPRKPPESSGVGSKGVVRRIPVEKEAV
jgi:hypothetical protein